MSYSTRRSGQQPQQPQQTVGAVGQRRPVVTNNFVSGGTLSNQTQQAAKTPAQAQQQAQRTPQQQNTNIQFRNQQTPQKPAVPQQQQQQTPAQKTAAQQQAAAAAAQQQAAAAAAAQQQAQQQAAAAAAAAATAAAAAATAAKAGFAPGVNPPNPGVKMEVQNGGAPAAEGGDDVLETTGVEGQKKRPFWARSGAKISKKEKLRRRNLRLSKMLQPKNAVMILNELVRQTAYTVDEMPPGTDRRTAFKVTVVVDGVEHIGYGHTKNAAKNAAAEMALKYVVKNNKLSEVKQDEDGVEKMEITEDDVNQPLPWQHVASFALFKLFTSWGEDAGAIKNALLGNLGGTNTAQTGGSIAGDQPIEMKPAKKMPVNPELMNPLMLLNQMMPHVQFEEIGKAGAPPNITFTFKCTVNGQSYTGSGSSKKTAKKMAAFAVCHSVLGVNYPPDVYQPSA